MTTRTSFGFIFSRREDSATGRPSGKRQNARLRRCEFLNYLLQLPIVLRNYCYYCYYCIVNYHNNTHNNTLCSGLEYTGQRRGCGL